MGVKGGKFAVDDALRDGSRERGGGGSWDTGPCPRNRKTLASYPDKLCTTITPTSAVSWLWSIHHCPDMCTEQTLALPSHRSLSSTPTSVRSLMADTQSSRPTREEKERVRAHSPNLTHGTAVTGEHVRGTRPPCRSTSWWSLHAEIAAAEKRLGSSALSPPGRHNAASPVALLRGPRSALSLSSLCRASLRLRGDSSE